MTQEKNQEKLKLPEHPLGESRPWIKLWVAPWLDGTTRDEMSGSQRAFWVDLLAPAARSRIAGVISPGQVNEKTPGYPTPRTWRVTRRHPELPWVKIGRHVFYAERDVEALISACRVKP